MNSQLSDALPGRQKSAAALAALALASALAACKPTTPPTAASPCDPGLTPCVAMTSLGEIELSLTPRPIQAMQTIQASVRTASSLDAVQLEMIGRDMDMGPNHNRLQPGGPGEWMTKTMLPVCVTGKMVWTARITLKRADQSAVTDFHFTAGGR